MEQFKKLLILLTLLQLSSCKLFEKYQESTIDISQSIEGKRFCIIGDTGTGSKKQFTVAKALESENCEYLIHVGDIIYDDGIKNASDPLVQERFVIPYQNIYKQAPTFLALGNHDHYGNPRAWIKVSRQLDNVFFPNSYYSIKTPELCFVVIDTHMNFLHGQEEWIKNEIGSPSKDCKHQVVIGHHPYTSSGYHNNSTGLRRAFLEKFVIGKVKLFIAGHDHNLSIEQPVKGTHLIVSGGGAKTRSVSNATKPLYSESKLGYMTMIHTNNQLNFEVKSVTKKGVIDTEFRYLIQL